MKEYDDKEFELLLKIAKLNPNKWYEYTYTVINGSIYQYMCYIGELLLLITMTGYEGNDFDTIKIEAECGGWKYVSFVNEGIDDFNISDINWLEYINPTGILNLVKSLKDSQTSNVSIHSLGGLLDVPTYSSMNPDDVIAFVESTGYTIYKNGYVFDESGKLIDVAKIPTQEQKPEAVVVTQIDSADNGNPTLDEKQPIANTETIDFEANQRKNAEFMSRGSWSDLRDDRKFD